MPDAAEALLRESIEPPGPSRSGLRLAALLAGVVGSRGQSSEIARLLHLTAGYAARDAEQLQTACLASLNDALKRGKPPALIDPAGVAALNQLLASSQPAVRRTALQTAGALKLAQSPEVVAVFEQAAQTALDTGRSLSDREAAVVLLGSGPFEVLRKAASVLLMACQPLTLQLAAVSALSQSDDADVAAVLLSDWGSYSPRLQSAVLDALFKRQERIRALLVAVQLNRIPRPGLEPVRQEQLRTNPDPEIRRLAEPWLQRALSSPDRQALLARYQIALSTPRDAVRGKELFQLHSRVTLIHARIGCGPASRLRFRERCGQTLSRQVRSLSKKQTPRISRIARFLGGFRQTARASASIGAVRGYLFGFMG